MDLKDIKAIIDLMKKNSIAEFEMEKEGFKIKLRRGATTAAGPACENGAQGVTVGQGTLPAPVVMSAPIPVAPAGPPQEEIKSPMIGTFYRAPSPESGAYVEVGAEVHPETVVCIIEAMKVMNEIKAEVKGVVTQILVENSKPVEFGQPLFKVRPI